MLIACRILGGVVSLVAMLAFVSGWLPDTLASLVEFGEPGPPVSNLVALFLGAALVIADTPRRELRALRTGLILCALGVALSGLLVSLEVPVFDLRPLVAGSWSALPDAATRPVSIAGFFGWVVICLTFLVIMVRQRDALDALVQVWLAVATYFLAWSLLAPLLPRSVAQIHYRYISTNSLQNSAFAMVIIVGQWCLWWHRRRLGLFRVEIARQRVKLFVSFAAIAFWAVGSQAAVAFSFARLDALHRDYLEALFRLQLWVVERALDRADNLSDSIAGRPLVAAVLAPSRGRGDPALAGQLAESMVRGPVAAVELSDPAGQRLAMAGVPLETSDFAIALDHEHDLIWDEGTALRSTLQLGLTDKARARLTIDVRLPEIDRMLRRLPPYDSFAEHFLCASLDAWRISCLPGGERTRPFRVDRALLGGSGGGAINRAIDGQAGSVLSADLEGRPIIAAYGGVPPYSLGMLAQTPEAEIARRHGRLFASVALTHILLAYLAVLMIRARYQPPDPGGGRGPVAASG